MVRVNCFGYVNLQNQSRASVLDVNSSKISPAFRGNILEKNPLKIITDLSNGNEVPGIKCFSIGKDLLHNIIMLFTYNHQGNVNGKLNAKQGSQMYSPLLQLAKNMKRG